MLSAAEIEATEQAVRSFFSQDPAAGELRVERYGYDERIGWDTHIVTFGGKVVGYTDGPLT